MGPTGSWHATASWRKVNRPLALKQRGGN
jgi:hypothetical protein